MLDKTVFCLETLSFGFWAKDSNSQWKRMHTPNRRAGMPDGESFISQQ